MELREIALDSLIEILEHEQFSHVIVNGVLQKNQYLDKQQRAFLTRLIEGTIERKMTLDFYINQVSKTPVEKMKPLVRTLMRMSVYQIVYMDSVPDSAACNEAVKLAKKRGFAKLSGFVNGVLRNISRQKDEIAPTDWANLYSVPDWFVEDLKAAYKAEKTKEILESFLEETPLTIRTNLSKISADELRKKLENEGVSVTPVADLDYAFAISNFDYLKKLEAFKEGLFFVQDLSSMYVAEVASPNSGDSVLDVCAAPGGKSLHLAEKLKDSGHVTSCDLTETKVAKIKENIDREKLSNITARVQDATEYVSEFENAFDVVVADCPCSGMGVLRKKPEIKYRMTKAQQNELAIIQKNILDNVCKYVKPDGKLLYSTCTINKLENENQIECFLANHSEFELVSMKQILPCDLKSDGFFIALLHKK